MALHSTETGSTSYNIMYPTHPHGIDNHSTLTGYEIDRANQEEERTHSAVAKLISWVRISVESVADENMAQETNPVKSMRRYAGEKRTESEWPNSSCEY